MARPIARASTWLGNHVREMAETTGRGIYRGAGWTKHQARECLETMARPLARASTWLGNHIKEMGETFLRRGARAFEDLSPIAAVNRRADVRLLFSELAEEEARGYEPINAPSVT
ncbi:hypothetical protein PsalMR5_00242 [Piscirickettsia salmonis]|nr:hypothetical protein PsalMR5_00242 [Piscirickettsia salmonis]